MMTIIINLAKNTNRKHAMQRKIKKTMIANYHFFNAIGNDLNKYSFKIIPDFIDPCELLPITTGCIGCTLSHYFVWKYIIDNNIQKTLILEDDATFYLNFDAELKRILDSGMQYDLFYLNRIPLNAKYKLGKETEIAPNVVIPKYCYNASSYIITYNGAKKMIASNCLNYLLPVDELLPIMYDPFYPFNEYSKYYDKCEKLIAYALKTNIADQESRDTFPSDIIGSPVYTAQMHKVRYKEKSIDFIINKYKDY